MSTIESLDLASLSNNPQSIATALEDVLETTNNNIGLLKQQVESDADDIQNVHLVNAQNDANTLSNLVASAPTADVLNRDLTVVDRTSVFDITSDYDGSIKAYSFNGIMFLNVNLHHSGTPVHAEVVMTINNANFYPVIEFGFPTQGYQGDTSHYLSIQHTGQIKLYDPENVGSSTYYLNCNGFYIYANDA